MKATFNPETRELLLFNVDGSMAGSAIIPGEETIRRIVREEIAAQKEQLFKEAMQYSTKVNLDWIEAIQLTACDTQVEPMKQP